jgi:predicted transcriptional regulator
MRNEIYFTIILHLYNNTAINDVKRTLQKPTSLKELEIVTGRKSNNLSRTLKMMSRYGIVDLVRQNRSVRPVVKATDFKVEFGLNTSFVQ